MAHIAAAVSAPHGTGSTKDLDRFRERLRGRAIPPHAYALLLGLEVTEAAILLRSVGQGLSYRAFERFRQNSALPVERLIELIGIPRRTMTRRKSEGRFLPDESDRLFRVARVFGRTLALFEGNRDAATEWLTSAQHALGGSVPLDLVRTEVGTLEVERLLGRLEHGVFS